MMTTKETTQPGTIGLSGSHRSTCLQGSIWVTFNELLAIFGQPKWGCDKELCRFDTANGNGIYLRNSGTNDHPKTNESFNRIKDINEIMPWCISGADKNAVREITTLLDVKPSEQWRITP